MRAERRLAKLEAAMNPQAAVLHWLAEVNEHGSLDAYVSWLLDQPASRAPAIVIIERARAVARAARAGEPRLLIREAERRAMADAVFLFELVIELECVANEAIRVGRSRLTALRWELRARTAESASDRRGWQAWRRAVLDLATDLARAEAVRRSVEDRYLDGRETLSPVALAAWRELREAVTALVETIPKLPGGRRGRRADGVAIDAAAERTAPDEARRLMDLLRAGTLDLLGDPGGSMAVAERGLRGEA